MKNLFMKLFYFRLLAVIGLLSTIMSCEEDKATTTPEDPEDPNVDEVVYSADFVLGTPGIYGVDIMLTGTNVVGYAYLVTTDIDADAPDAAIIFAEGVTGSVTESETTISVASLEGNTQYKIFICAEFDTIGYGDVVELESFTTEGYSEFVTLLTPDDMYSVKMYISVPEGSTVSYMAMDLDNYDTFIGSYAWITADFFSSVKSNQTVITESQVVSLSGFGPGQAVKVLVSEVEDGELDYYGRETYQALYDYDGYSSDVSTNGSVDSDDYWLTEFHYAETTNTTPPVLVDAPVECEIISTTTQTVTMKFTMNDQVDQFVYSSYTAASWEYLVEYFGFDGAIYFSTAYYEGLGTESMTYTATGLQLGLTYQMVLVGHANEEGTEHSINIVEYAPSEATLPAPTITVTAIDTPEGEVESPLQAWFNIKCDNKDAYYIKYLCNEYRAWMFEYNSGGTNTSLMAANGNIITDSSIIDAVNSDAGYNIVFDSWEETTTRLLVVAVNSEETQSDAEAESSYADYTTGSLPAVDPVDSDLFESLKGEWTAHAYRMEVNDITGEYYPSTTETTAQVTIGYMPSYPDELSDDVYNAYYGMTTEEVDALFEEFKVSSQKYEDKLKGQNRILCQGLDVGSFSTTYYSPFDLFYDDYYAAAVTTDDLFFDYGPKWTLEVNADGSVIVPVDINTIPPFNGYSYTYPLRLFAIEPYEWIYNTDITSFDVTVSDDRNTITILPKEHEGYTYYFSAAYVMYGYLIQSFVCHELVLTRNDSSASAPSYVAPTSVNYPKIPTDLKLQATHPRTRLTVTEAAKAKAAELESLPSIEGAVIDVESILSEKAERAIQAHDVK
ncbi:MAG: hypothetical protein SNH07_04480 [Rikenellaceae bacterium]